MVNWTLLCTLASNWLEKCEMNVWRRTFLNCGSKSVVSNNSVLVALSEPWGRGCGVCVCVYTRVCRLSDGGGGGFGGQGFRTSCGGVLSTCGGLTQLCHLLTWRPSTIPHEFWFFRFYRNKATALGEKVPVNLLPRDQRGLWCSRTGVLITFPVLCLNHPLFLYFLFFPDV